MSEIIFKLVFPILGTIIGISTAVASFVCALECRKLKNLDAIDPFPYVFSFANNFNWLVYGMLIKDVYILVGGL